MNNSAALSNLVFSKTTVTDSSCYLAAMRPQNEALSEMCKLLSMSNSTTWLQNNRKKLSLIAITRLSDLQENWDGEGAREIDSEASAMATSLLDFLPDALPEPDIFPNPNGTISLFWSLTHGTAELEIGRTRHSWVLLNLDGRAIKSCSGDNRAFEHSQPTRDLINALSPSTPSNCGARPMTNLQMMVRWDDVVQVY